MFQSDWLILRILHQSFEIERLKGHWSEVGYADHRRPKVDLLCQSLKPDVFQTKK